MDGFVSRDELAVWLKLHIPSCQEKNVDNAFQTIDANKDGKISAQEFVDCYFDFWYSTKMINLFGNLFDFEGK